MEKRLMRNVEDEKIAGVCSGVATYFDVDPTIVRIIWGIAFFSYGIGLLLYLVCWLLFPKNEEKVVYKASKRLMKDKQDVKIAGVCSGVAAYFGWDTTLVRVVWAASLLAFGAGLVPYLICWWVMPEPSTADVY